MTIGSIDTVAPSSPQTRQRAFARRRSVTNLPIVAS
jgi:hypothetical protein